MEMPKAMFTYGQFELESFFVIPNYSDKRFCRIIINGIEMTTGDFEKSFKESDIVSSEELATKICNDFLSNKIIDVLYDEKYYNLNTLIINDKKVVVMRKGKNKTT